MPDFRTVAEGGNPVGAYEPLLELGRGGMGAVHLAKAVGAGGFERLVVVKRLHAHLLEEKSAVRRFMDEAKLAASIHHANVVGIHQVGRDDEGFFLVLDYVEGGSLDDLVDRSALKGRTLAPELVLRIALDALSGLHAVHEAHDTTGRRLDILHRDVSLQNVLVGRDGVARIADFGIAKSAVGSVSTDQKYIVGKLLYLPPEYLKREPVGPTLDVYALGMTMWIALAGTDPWPDATEAQLITHAFQGVPPLTSQGVQIAPQVSAVVERACALDPANRFQTAREMADAIEAVGRNTGWIASHAEVASYLDELIGVDLGRRRERVAALLGGQDDDRPTYTALEAASAPRASAAASGRDTTAAAVELPMNRRSPVATAAIGLVAVGTAVAGTIVWLGRTGPEPIEEPAAASSSPPAAPSSPSAAPNDAGFARTEAGPHNGDVTTGPAATPRHVTAKTRKTSRPTSKKTPSPSPEKSAPDTPPDSPAKPRAGGESPPAVAPAPATTSPSDGISKTNPYRK